MAKTYRYDDVIFRVSEISAILIPEIPETENKEVKIYLRGVTSIFKIYCDSETAARDLLDTLQKEIENEERY